MTVYDFGTLPDGCLLCNQPYVHNPAARVGVSVQAWVHEQCMNNNGMQLHQLDAIAHNCDAFKSLVNLCGSLFQPNDRIPRMPFGAGGEIWRAVPSIITADTPTCGACNRPMPPPGSGQIIRYRLDEHGRFTVVEVPLMPPPPAAEGS